MVSPIAKHSYTNDLRSQAPRRLPRVHSNGRSSSPEDAPHRNTRLSHSHPKRKSNKASVSPYQIPTRLPIDESSSAPPSPTISDPQSLPSDSSTSARSRSRGSRYYQGVSERKRYLDTSPNVLAYSEESVTCAWCRRDVRLDCRGEARYYLGFFKKHLETRQCRTSREEVSRLFSFSRVLNKSLTCC